MRREKRARGETDERKRARERETEERERERERGGEERERESQRMEGSERERGGGERERERKPERMEGSERERGGSLFLLFLTISCWEWGTRLHFFAFIVRLPFCSIYYFFWCILSNPMSMLCIFRCGCKRYWSSHNLLFSNG